MALTYAKLLTKAADVLERDGWTQKRYHERTHYIGDNTGHHARKSVKGPHCMVGAMIVAHAESKFFKPESCESLLRKDFPMIATSQIIERNDREFRTADEAIADLRRMAEREKAIGR